VRRLAPLLALLAACAIATPQQKLPQRVVLLSFDGLSADQLDARRANLPTFSRLQREGMMAKRLIPVTPTQTSVGHVAMLTGKEPDKTGIVANRFRGGDGFTTEIEAETLVEAAKRAGKRVGAIAFPTVDARNERRRADFGLVWTQPLTRSRLIHLSGRARIDWSVPGHTPVPIDVTVHNGTVAIKRGEQELLRDDQGWFAVSQRIEGTLYGSWSRLVNKTSDDVTIYWGSISSTQAYPEAFQQLLEREAGFPPGPADAEDHDTFVQEIERTERYYTTVIATAIREMHFDLLLAYQPFLDRTDHEHPTVDAIRARAYAAADHCLTTITELLDPSRDALIVAGDHALAVAETLVRVDRLLEEWGFGTWQVYTGGSVVLLYGDDRPDELATRLRQSGYFQQVSRRGPDSHPHSGDITAFSYPHISLMSGQQGPAVSKPVRPFGHHGGLATNPVFHSRFYAWGATIHRRMIEQMHQTEIAPYLAALLRISLLSPYGPPPDGNRDIDRDRPRIRRGAAGRRDLHPELCRTSQNAGVQRRGIRTDRRG
jgi:hypothetical protein